MTSLLTTTFATVQSEFADVSNINNLLWINDRSPTTVDKNAIGSLGDEDVVSAIVTGIESFQNKNRSCSRKTLTSSFCTPLCIQKRQTDLFQTFGGNGEHIKLDRASLLGSRFLEDVKISASGTTFRVYTNPHLLVRESTPRALSRTSLHRVGCSSFNCLWRFKISWFMLRSRNVRLHWQCWRNIMYVNRKSFFAGRAAKPKWIVFMSKASNQWRSACMLKRFSDYGQAFQCPSIYHVIILGGNVWASLTLNRT